MDLGDISESFRGWHIHKDTLYWFDGSTQLSVNDLHAWNWTQSIIKMQQRFRDHQKRHPIHLNDSEIATVAESLNTLKDAITYMQRCESLLNNLATIPDRSKHPDRHLTKINYSNGHESN